MIYHYCSVPVMEKIFCTKEIWLSDITKMNEMSNENLNETFKILIGCFSKNGDLKSQWSEYADQAQGVSIGFNEEKIKQFNLFNRFTENGFEPISNKVQFIKVNYNESILREYAKAIVEHYIQSDSIIKWQLLARNLMHLSISYKDSFFIEEDEIRAVITTEERHDDKYLIEKRSTNYGNADYHRLNTSYQNFSSIEEVIIGPKSVLSITDVEQKLKKAGITEVKVKQSVATGKYR
ncbi:DUF2971 domain-containing protein [Vibrio sp. ED002]|uniref:DUF2971 domain-containing protein n=1 Tax=Vibrio sp. ED002 TaxID=2785123 RepID=UPI00200E3BF2|nr:DUF2971 domain-containing protein [Vibrio sp. ED002]UQA51003.1 DUF2971 domain-containing protein [Vibrio sp. ED002]